MNSKAKNRLMFALGVAICFAVAGLSVGKMTFFVMIFTFAMCFGGGYFIRKVFGLNWKLSNLISAGTGITDFKKAGLAPMFYGITIDTLVTITALIVIWCMGLM